MMTVVPAVLSKNNFFYFFIFALANRRIQVRMTCVLVCAHPGGLPIMGYLFREKSCERIRDLEAESPCRKHG